MPLNLAEINQQYMIQKYAVMRNSVIIWKPLVL